MKMLGSMLFLFACVLSVPVYAEEPTPLYTELLDLRKGEVTSDWKCEMDNGAVYDCVTVKFEKQDYVIAADSNGIVGEWLLKDQITTLLWKRTGITFGN